MVCKSAERVIGFDIIRLLACLFVCIVHFNASVAGWQNGINIYPNTIVPSYILDNRVYLGTLGVQLFFIVSGASLMISWKSTDRPIDFYRKRVLNIYPQFWIAFAAATYFDFFLYKGMAQGRTLDFAISFAGLDGYLSALGMIPFQFFKVGEWFLGCIIILYLVFPVVKHVLDKYPTVTCAFFLFFYLFSLYAICRQIPYIGSSAGITICACEMFFGMVWMKYRLDQKKYTLFASLALFLANWFLRKYLPNDLLTFTTAFLILEVVVHFSGRIHSEAVKEQLQKASALTYSIFMVHHFISDRMIRGFDLAHIPRLYTYTFFSFFVLASVLLAMALKKAGGCFTKWLSKHEAVLTGIMLLLLSSFGYTIYRVVQYICI